jgi:hypothetical protein
VDQSLHVWDYMTAENVASVDTGSQLIVAVGLCKPNASVFRESVKVS